MLKNDDIPQTHVFKKCNEIDCMFAVAAGNMLYT